MIKKILLCSLCLGFAAQLVAPFGQNCGCSCDCNTNCACEQTYDNWQIMFKQGYFLPHDKNLRCMFRSGCNRPGGYILEGALRYRLVSKLFLELSGGWFKHNGCSIVCVKTVTTKNATAALPETAVPAAVTPSYGEPFCFKLPTFGFGLKYFVDLCCDCVNIFAGAGGKAFFMRTNACYPGCCTCDKENTVGGYVGAGFQWLPFCGFTLEAYADYFIKRLSVKNAPSCSVANCLDLGGLAVGLGIGYTF